MPYRPSRKRLNELNRPFRVKLIITERVKTGWTFELRWWDGKRQRSRCLNSQDFALARKARDRMDANYLEILKSKVSLLHDLDLSELRQLYLENCKSRNLALDTVKTASWMLNSLVSFLDDPHVESIKAEDVEDYISAQLSKGRKPRGVVSDVKLFRTVFNWAVKRQYMHSNPANDVELPRVPRSVPRRLSLHDIKRLLITIQKNRTHSDEDRAITLILILTGLRINELISLEWESIDFENDVIVVRGKGGHERIVLIGSYLKEILISLPRHNESKLLFPGIRYHGKKKMLHGKKSYSTLRKRFSKYYLDAGIEPGKGTFHRLRHTVGSVLGDEGYSSLQIASVLGHASEQTTKIYTTISDKRVRDMAEELSVMVKSIIE